MDSAKKKEDFKNAAEKASPSFFENFLEKLFGSVEKDKILETLEGLQLPIPKNEDEFIAGTEGGIIFINRYGVVLRIEEKDPLKDIHDCQWVLDPLKSIKTGKAVLEICPACAFESDKKRYQKLKSNLKKEGLSLWDSGLRQLGRVPLKMPQFPDGMTVVVDRQAVRYLSEATDPIRKNLQRKFYAPLREKIDAAYDGKTFNAEKVKSFWEACERFVEEGKLVAGWNDYKPLYDNGWEYKTPTGPKGLLAQKKAHVYETRFSKQVKKTLFPAAKDTPPHTK